jgi:DNA repair exonuclease SbcCD ATPase subunit
VKVELKHFMSHKASTFTLPAKGVVQLTGPNGAGKSALIEAFATALWGQGLRGSKWTPWQGTTPGYVLIEGGGLSVQRSWSGKSKRLLWSKTNQDEIEFDTTTKAQSALESVVGPFEVWRRTNVFSAADAAHFTLSTDSERKELIEKLLGLGWFEQALDACRSDLRAAHGSKNATQRDVDQWAARAQALTEGLRRLQSVLESTPPIPEVGLRRAEMARLTDHMTASLADERTARAKLNALLEAGGEDRARAAMAQRQLAKLGDGDCHTCGQPIPDTMRADLSRAVESAMASANAAVASIADQARALKAELEELGEETATLRGMVNKLNNEITNVERSRHARMRAEEELKSQGDEIFGTTQKVATAMTKLEGLKVELAELEACERVLGVRGARAHIVAGTLLTIEGLTNERLAQLGTDVRIALSPYTEKKSGGVVDAISLGLRGAGGDHGYTGASAGERRRVDVALLLALAEMSSARATQWPSPIFFDEVFDSLDGDGREAVGELVEGLAQTRCVVLITHDESIGASRADMRIRVDDGVVS